MATVRCLERCYFNHRVYDPGAVFDYNGPKQAFLALVEGEWEKASQGGPVDPEQLRRENAAMRKQLEKMSGEPSFLDGAADASDAAAKGASKAAAGKGGGEKAGKGS